MDPVTIGALTVGVGSLFSSLFGGLFGKSSTDKTNATNERINTQNLRFNEEQNRINRDFSMNMLHAQHQYNLSDWNMQNDYNEQMYEKYNTPSAQVRQLAEAGINPNMAFGGSSSYSPVQSLGSNSGSVPGSLGAPSPLGMIPDRSMAEALMRAGSDGSSMLSAVLGVPKANARLLNANAERQEIENARARSYDDTLRSGLVYNPKTMEIKFASELGEYDEGFEPLIRPRSYNKGTFDAVKDFNDWLVHREGNDVRKLQLSFEKSVAEKMPDVKVDVNGKLISAAEAIARMKPQEFKQQLLDAVKTSQDTNTSKSQEDLNKENKIAVQNQNQGVSQTGKAIENWGKKGVFQGSLDVIKAIISDFGK